MRTEAAGYRRRINLLNQVLAGLQRVGIVFGEMRMLTVTGRHSGKPRTFPIELVHLGGTQYLIQVFPKADWVANARAAGGGTLARGRRSSEVRLVELPIEQRRPILREMILTCPPDVADRYVTVGMTAAPTADAVVAAAERIAVFRVEPG
ncbi:nitroreductase family deazaflavin-dependent oxidoreductase [Amycolatopsis ultiminotia]|uniref:Nitroreductase family deazaflavin-dependent oxidoreductase n=1 Tax=Amycolatopsis ultiminotia TaxID=543629 RepID=A0ABP6XU18_9PSEU